MEWGGGVEGAGEGEEDGEGRGGKGIEGLGERSSGLLLETRAGLWRAPCWCLSGDGPALRPRLRVGD